jgi:hypothetical protein
MQVQKKSRNISPLSIIFINEFETQWSGEYI